MSKEDQKHNNINSIAVIYFSLFALVLLFFNNHAFAEPVNLILNGDFESVHIYNNEDGPVSDGGWTFWDYAFVEGNGSGSVYSVRLESVGSQYKDPTIAQTVTGLTAGTKYTLSWDLSMRYNISGSGTDRSFGVFLDEQDYDNNIFFDEYLEGEYGTPSYKNYKINFIATANTHTIFFAGELDDRTNGGVGNTDVSYNIDNIKLTAAPVPIPGALWLLGSGIAAIIGIRRKGNRRDKD